MIKGRESRTSYAIKWLRRASYQWPEMNKAMGNARLSRGVYKCARCKKQFKREDVQRDHIIPVVPLTGWDSFDKFIERLYCDAEGIQILCRPCHKDKSNKENEERRKHKKIIKAKEKG